MTKVKELSVEDLQRDLGRLQGLKTEAEGRIRGLREAIDLAEVRDAELFRQSLIGKDTAKERSRLRDQTEEKQGQLNREVGDLTILAEELERVDLEITAARKQGNTDRVEASNQRRTAGLPATAREIREALAGPVARLEELWAEYQDERQLRNRLHGSFACPGEQVLLRLRHLVTELVTGARAIEEGRP